MKNIEVPKMGTLLRCRGCHRLLNVQEIMRTARCVCGGAQFQPTNARGLEKGRVRLAKNKYAFRASSLDKDKMHRLAADRGKKFDQTED